MPVCQEHTVYGQKAVKGCIYQFNTHFSQKDCVFTKCIDTNFSLDFFFAFTSRNHPGMHSPISLSLGYQQTCSCYFKYLGKINTNCDIHEAFALIFLTFLEKKMKPWKSFFNKLLVPTKLALIPFIFHTGNKMWMPHCDVLVLRWHVCKCVLNVDKCFYMVLILRDLWFLTQGFSPVRTQSHSANV